jgi:hypothetical protein
MLNFEFVPELGACSFEFARITLTTTSGAGTAPRIISYGPRLGLVGLHVPVRRHALTLGPKSEPITGKSTSTTTSDISDK